MKYEKAAFNRPLIGFVNYYLSFASKNQHTRREAVERSLQNAFTGRKLRKRDFRSLWILRINAGARLSGLSYSRFMHGLKVAGIALNRKVLADLAVYKKEDFAQVVELAKAALSK